MDEAAKMVLLRNEKRFIHKIKCIKKNMCIRTGEDNKIFFGEQDVRI